MRSRGRIGRLLIWGGILLALGVPASVRAEVRGRVLNGTTGRPVAGIEVHLVVLEEGMQVAERARTDAQGRFVFSANPTKPMMVRATYGGVNYHEMVSSTGSEMTLRVYEARSQGPYRVERLSYLVQPVEDRLLIGREYIVRNQTSPPMTLNRAEGVFAFSLPEGVRPERVSVIGASGLPLTIGAREEGGGRWRIEYPLRPGETQFFVVSQIPYGEKRATIREVLPWDADRVRLLIPEPMTVEATQFRPLGSEQGLSVYVLDDARAGTEIAWNVSGTAPAALGGEGERATGTIQAVAGPVGRRQWLILMVLVLAFAMSGVIAVRRQRERAGSRERSPAPSEELRALKEALFALEVRRQRREISEAEYAERRHALERALETFVRAPEAEERSGGGAS